MMDSIFNDVWFGKIGEYTSVEYSDSSMKKLLEILAVFQKGDFSQITELPKISKSSSNTDVRRLALRLFLSAASHNDMILLSDMIDETSENDVNDFCYFSESSLSLQTLPYLLAMLETWEGTDVGEIVCQTIGYIIDCPSAQDGDCSPDEVADECKLFLDTHDPQKYYYAGSEFFIGNFTKQLLNEVMTCKAQGKPYYSGQISSILSIATGIKCPVQPGVQITDLVAEKVMRYVKIVSAKKWMPGCKYFYGNIITNT